MQEKEGEKKVERRNEKISEALLKFILFNECNLESIHHTNLNKKEPENWQPEAKSLSKN